MSGSTVPAAPEGAAANTDRSERPTETVSAALATARFETAERAPAARSGPAATGPEALLLGRYVLQEQLGVGATASVWRARDTERETEVAVKLLHPHLATDPTALARIEAEAAAVRSLAHPSIVPILDAHLTSSEAALVFPYIEGETLGQRLAGERGGGRLPARTAASIAADIADALAFAHQAAVVHRDVKPSNILVAEDGRARLLDFGISRSLAMTANDLTGTGMAIGTLPYMPPEQLAGEPAQTANDVFALGAVLYQMLSGQRPFEASSPLALAQAQRSEPAPIRDAPRPLVVLALAALAYEPASRPTAGELAEALHAWLEGRALPLPALAAMPVPANTDAPTVVAPAPAAADGRSGNRRRVVLAGALIATLALLALSAFAFTPDQSAETAPTSRPSPAATLPGMAVDEEVDEKPLEADDADVDAVVTPNRQQNDNAPEQENGKDDRDTGRENERGGGDDKDDNKGKKDDDQGGDKGNREDKGNKGKGGGR